MAQFHYHQRQKFHLAQTPSMPATAPNANFVATRSNSDTMVRTLWSPRMVTQIDPAVNPPVEGWWVDAEMQLSIRFDPTGVGGPGASPFLTTTVGTVTMYPTFVRDSPANALEFVVWTPLISPTVIETSRKGDGAHIPVVNASLWAADFHAVFANPGAAFSVKHSVNWNGTVIWSSNSP